jgi:26S proteasome regulatory subunit N2
LLSFRLFEKVINDKHEGPLAKMGGILGQGIIDAGGFLLFMSCTRILMLLLGGRNVTISLESRTGHTSMKTAVGLLLFQQFWYWFPLANFLSLAFTSTALIGLNKELKVRGISCMLLRGVFHSQSL